MKAFLKPLAYCLALAFVGFACSEEEPEAPQPPIKALNEWDQSMWQIEQIASEVELLVRDTYPSGSNFLACSSVQTALDPDGLETTFTFTGAACLDGKTRSGQITLFTSSKINLEGVIYLDNYQVNGTTLDGAFAFQRQQVPGKVQVLRLVSSNAQVLPATGGSFRYTVNRVTHQTAGTATPYDPSDDVVEVFDADYSCLKQNGAFEATLITPVVLKKTCAAPANLKPLQGKILIELSTGQKSTLNFGDGTCVAQPYAE